MPQDPIPIVQTLAAHSGNRVAFIENVLAVLACMSLTLADWFGVELCISGERPGLACRVRGGFGFVGCTVLIHINRLQR